MSASEGPGLLLGVPGGADRAVRRAFAALEPGTAVSRRELAGMLGVSVGYAGVLLRRLTDAGEVRCLIEPDGRGKVYERPRAVGGDV
jgi:hypothetical protein